ncbi:MAG: hypothetical protein H3Z52_04730 [archaeon]|nr:hypothetical protein [archaeon]MCP8320234.1 hypothetical protein [archaeon]
MTIIIDTKTLTVSYLSENVEVVITEKDAWESEQYKRKVRVFGTIKRWTLNCYEKDVAWADSVAKHLQTKAKEGNAVNFTVDEGTMHQVNTNVYVLGVDLTYESGVANYRTFSISLQEAV